MARAGFSKYRAVRTEVDGIKFASKREAAVYQEFRLLEQAGQIRDLKLQPAFPLIVNGVKVAPRPFHADFAFYDVVQEKHRIIDVKGMDTREGKLRRKLAEALHGVEIEVMK